MTFCLSIAHHRCMGGKHYVGIDHPYGFVRSTLSPDKDTKQPCSSLIRARFWSSSRGGLQEGKYTLACDPWHSLFENLNHHKLLSAKQTDSFNEASDPPPNISEVPNLQEISAWFFCNYIPSLIRIGFMESKLSLPKKGASRNVFSGEMADVGSEGSECREQILSKLELWNLQRSSCDAPLHPIQVICILGLGIQVMAPKEDAPRKVFFGGSVKHRFKSVYNRPPVSYKWNITLLPVPLQSLQDGGGLQFRGPWNGLSK